MTGLSDTEPLPISLVAQHVFCPRRAWLEAAGETTDTYQMAVGIAEHAPTENPATGRPDRLRIVEVVHPEWGIIGRCDTVERESDGSLTVIEHKATPVRRRRFVLNDRERAVGLTFNGVAPPDDAPLWMDHLNDAQAIGPAGRGILGRRVLGYTDGHLVRVRRLASGFQPRAARAEHMLCDKADGQRLGVRKAGHRAPPQAGSQCHRAPAVPGH